MYGHCMGASMRYGMPKLPNGGKFSALKAKEKTNQKHVLRQSLW